MYIGGRGFVYCLLLSVCTIVSKPTHEVGKSILYTIQYINRIYIYLSPKVGWILFLNGKLTKDHIKKVSSWAVVTKFRNSICFSNYWISEQMKFLQIFYFCRNGLLNWVNERFYLSGLQIYRISHFVASLLMTQIFIKIFRDTEKVILLIL